MLLVLTMLACEAEDDKTTDSGGETGTLPTIESPPLVINEFLAKNDATNADANGEFDDWVELYNNGSTIVQLDGFYLSDDELEPTKFAFPTGQGIEAGGYLLVWCDGEAAPDTKGDLHTSFKLDKKGEVLYLTYSDGEQVGQADAVQWNADQAADVAAARVPDGTKNWVLQTPTPEATNGG
jgi:hypothetical protein